MPWTGAWPAPSIAAPAMATWSGVTAADAVAGGRAALSIGGAEVCRLGAYAAAAGGTLTARIVFVDPDGTIVASTPAWTFTAAGVADARGSHAGVSDDDPWTLACGATLATVVVDAITGTWTIGLNAC